MNVLRYLKTSLAGLFLAGVAAVLAFGPRNSGRSTAPPGFTEVTYWEKWTGNEGAQMQIIVDDFNNSVGLKKHIYVKCLTISNIEERTLGRDAAGVPPDVAGLTDEQIAQFAALDALEPLDELDLAGHGITREAYKPVCWDGCVFEGHLWALPSTPAPVALHYNKRILQENAAALRAAGFDPEQIPTLLADFDRFARVLDRREGNGKILRAGYLAMEPGWFINFTPYWFGASYFDDADRQIHADRSRGRADVPVDSRLFGPLHAGCDHAIPKRRSGSNSTQNPFLTGAVAMEQQGCWTANFIEDLAPAMNRWQRFEREEPAMIAAGMTDRDERWRRFEDEIGAELRPLDARQRHAALANKIADESELDDRRAASKLRVGSRRVSLRHPWARQCHLHWVRRADHSARRPAQAGGIRVHRLCESTGCHGKAEHDALQDFAAAQGERPFHELPSQSVHRRVRRTCGESQFARGAALPDLAGSRRRDERHDPEDLSA